MNYEEDWQIADLLREHSLWITQEYERGLLAGERYHDFLIQSLAQYKQVHVPSARLVIAAYMYLRHLHFARRTKCKIKHSRFLDMIADWTPPGWVYNCFPLPTPDREIVTLTYVVDAMHEEADRCTDWDGTPLGRVLHVAHMLVCFQGDDGLWPAMLNLRTGEEIGDGRSSAPRDLFRRLNKILGSTEFDFAIRRCEAGILSQKAK